MPSRSTPYKIALASILNDTGKAYSLAEIRQELEKRGYAPHRTTLFRDLRTLICEDRVEVIGRGTTRSYKGRPQSSAHYHHAVCDTCNTVLSIELPQVEAALAQAEHDLAAESSFVTFGHFLSVTGRCASCQGGSK